METLLDAARWLSDPANWTGTRGILARLWEHLLLSAVPVAAAVATALPAGLLAGHRRRGQLLGAAVVNVGRAVPTLALLVAGLLLSLALGLGLGYWPSVFAFYLVALHPIFTNAYAGIREVDPAVVEAARGVGLSERQVLLEVELPIALPVVLAAVRIAAVQVVATAPLAALVAGGGLGRFVLDGFAQFRYDVMIGGIVLIGTAALLTELAFDRVERALVPRGVRRAGVKDVAAVARAV